MEWNLSKMTSLYAFYDRSCTATKRILMCAANEYQNWFFSFFLCSETWKALGEIQRWCAWRKLVSVNVVNLLFNKGKMALNLRHHFQNSGLTKSRWNIGKLWKLFYFFKIKITTRFWKNLEDFRRGKNWVIFLCVKYFGEQ